MPNIAITDVELILPAVRMSVSARPAQLRGTHGAGPHRGSPDPGGGGSRAERSLGSHPSCSVRGHLAEDVPTDIKMRC